MINYPNHRSLSHILGFAVTVAIWPKEVVACRNFILGSVATFWVMSLVGIYPGRASLMLITLGTKSVKGSLGTGKLPRAFKNSA